MFAAISKAYKRISRVCKEKAISTAVGRNYIARRAQRQWAEFQTQNPTLVEYTKPYREPAQLAFKWISQGLVISNRKQAERIIFRENYFRFKAYAIHGIKPFMVDMFATVPVFSRDMASMGFPLNWETDPIW